MLGAYVLPYAEAMGDGRGDLDSARVFPGFDPYPAAVRKGAELPSAEWPSDHLMVITTLTLASH